MTTEMRLPGRTSVAYQEILEFIRNSAMMRYPSTFALKLQKKNIGEEAIMIALKSVPDLPILFMPPTALRTHDIDTLKGAVRSEAERHFGKMMFAGDLTLWETLRLASLKSSNRRMIIWLDFTEVPLDVWRYWRIAIEQDICTIVFTCTTSQWTKAMESIPEFTDCVFQATTINGFLKRDDLDQLKGIVCLYVTAELSGSVLESISKKLSVGDIELISEIDFQKVIWNVMKGGP